MRIKRLVISWIFVFTYLFGFAHYFIPHCDASSLDHQLTAQNEVPHHHHEHHHHHHHASDEKDVDHVDIFHNDHFDTGLFDYLLCFFIDAEHSAEDCNLQNYQVAKANSKIVTKLSTANFVVLLFFDTNRAELDEQVPAFSFYQFTDYHSPLLLSSPDRGPPFISC